MRRFPPAVGLRVPGLRPELNFNSCAKSSRRRSCFTPTREGYHFRGTVVTGEWIAGAVGGAHKGASPGGRHGVYEVPAVAWFAA